MFVNEIVRLSKRWFDCIEKKDGRCVEGSDDDRGGVYIVKSCVGVYDGFNEEDFFKVVYLSEYYLYFDF